MPLLAAQCYEDSKFILGMENGPREQWQMWQRQRLREMLAWLSQKPHWAEYVRPAGANLDAYDSWESMPVMKRETYRHFIEAHEPNVPASHGPVHIYSTSGSTGVPVSFWFSKVASRLIESHYWADGRRQNRPLDSAFLTLNAKGQPHEGDHEVRPADPWIHSGLFLARYSPSFTMKQNVEWLQTQIGNLPSPRKLVLLATYPALLSGLLSVIESGDAAPMQIDQIATSAETVEPALRARAKAAMGASIRDRYSCEELGPIAFQCPKSDEYQHVAVMNVMVEIVDSRGDGLPWGTPGNVLVTGLHQWASPALRYELGDIGAMLPECPACGVQVPVFSNLLGRKRCLVKRDNGDMRYVRVIAKDWLSCAPVREHRLVQVEPKRFEVELVLDAPLTIDQLAALDAMLHQKVGDEFAFDIIERDAIAWPPGRKRQELISLVG